MRTTRSASGGSRTRCRGTAYDTPVVGYKVNSVNLLRLWLGGGDQILPTSRPSPGDHYGAVGMKMVSENIKLPGPLSQRRIPQGKQPGCSSSTFRVVRACGHAPPALPEEPRPRALLQQVRGPAERHPSGHRRGGTDAVAGGRTSGALGHRLGRHQPDGFTNHTFPGGLGTSWGRSPVACRHSPGTSNHLRSTAGLEEVRLQFPGDDDRVRRTSLHRRGPADRYVRYGQPLARVGSHSINGVCCCTRTAQDGILRDFFE